MFRPNRGNITDGRERQAYKVLESAKISEISCVGGPQVCRAFKSKSIPIIKTAACSS